MRSAILFRCALLCILLLAFVEVRADLSPGQARKLITRMPGFDLPNSSVRVRKVSSNGASSAEAAAEIQIAFRFSKNAQGYWRILEVRTGPEQWQQIELITSTETAEGKQSLCDEPALHGKTSVTDPDVKRARCLLAHLLGLQLPSDAVRIKNISTFGLPMASRPSALVEAVLRIDVRFERDNSGWAVTGLRSISSDWLDPRTFVDAVNEHKKKRAREELEEIAGALEVFKAERGSYVTSDREPVLINHLSPRYLSRVICIDPWNKPYRYFGESNRFTLSSAGPDGKEQTSDDIIVLGPFVKVKTQSLSN
jgi:type II secretion system (T2SS) protein G